MTSQVASHPRLRYCVQRIELKPTDNVKNNLCAKLLIDGELVHELPPIKRGHPLVWDTPLFCTAGPNSTCRLKIHEESYLGLRHTAKYSFEFPVSDITTRSSTQIIERASNSLSALISISNSDVTLPEAVAVVQNIKTPQATLDRLGVSRGAFKTILDFGTAISEINPFAKAALSVCQIAWQKLEAQSKCDETIEQLLVGFADILKSIRPVKELARSEDLKRTIGSILELIQDASMFIIDYKSENQAERMASVFASSSQDKVQEFLNQLKRLKENFDRELSVQEYLDRMNEELNKLKPVGHSTYHHRQPCLAGTRATLISDIDEWIRDDTSNDNLLWVYGLAGLGKSSIATSVCQLLEDRNMLGASFFCKRDDKYLREPQRVMSTIIYRLARHYVEYGKLVVSAIRNDPELCGLPLRLQYNGLVKALLARTEPGVAPPSTAVVVVDALDECGTTESRRELLSCLLDMSQLVPWLKVIATSRPDQDITESFDVVPATHMKRINVREYDASDDIYAFLQKRMGSQSDSETKFDDGTIRLVTERAAGLFIWAETASRFILDGFDPHEQLAEVLRNSATGDATEQLDLLYSTALTSSMRCTNENNKKILKKCLGVIVATGLRTPLSVLNLGKLLDASSQISPKVLGKVVKALGSVLYEDSDGAVRVYHHSFSDYITTPSRSNDLCVDLMEHNALLSTCCLNTMLKELKFNICGLETSYRLNKDVPALDSRVNSAIGLHLSYSCQYWISHITDADPNRVEIHLLREYLFSRTLFYWIEALSLLNKLDVAISALLSLTRWRQSPDDCSKCANDAYRFILNFYDAISESTPHLYLSALPFAPTESEFVQRGTKWFPNTLKLKVGAEKHWTACLRTVAHPSAIGCLGVSSDGCRIVSGLGGTFHNPIDNALRIWDAETGAQVFEPLLGHSDSVLTVAFSPDGRYIASGSDDKTVRLWDAQTGANVSEPFTKHSSAVKYVAFSGDGRRVVSGCRKAIRIWDVQTGAEVSGPLAHNAVCRGCIAFSPDDEHIFSIDDDRMMTTWDATTGAQVSKALIHSSSRSEEIAAFSPDGRRVILSLHISRLQIGDFQMGNKVFTPWSNLSSPRGPPSRMAFSPDGRRVAAGFYDGTIEIWDPQNRIASASFVAHSDRVTSVVFSPDGWRLISGSEDKTVRIWDIESGAESFEPRTSIRKGPSGRVFSVAFSPDGRRIVSASGRHDQLDIWDAETGVNISPPPFDDLRFYFVRSVAFSSDGQCIISESRDKTKMWDVETGANVSEPHVGDLRSLLPQGLRFSSRIERVIPDMVAEGEGEGGFGSFDLDPVVSCLTVSLDGRRIASGSKGNTVRIWDAETGAAVSKPLVGHSDKVLCAAFSPDGRRIVSGSCDSTVRVWDIESSAEVHEPLRGHSEHVKSVAFSFDGRRIVSGGSDSTLRIWNLDSSPAPELPTNLTYFSRHMDSKGWVSLKNRPCLFWIPDQYGRAKIIDDSALCISSEPSAPFGVIIDFSPFVHGTSWTKVAGN